MAKSRKAIKEKRARDDRGRMESELKKRFGDQGGVRFFRAPGRVDWLGSHTDYNQGLILASTVDREIVVGARLRGDGALNFYSLDFDHEVRASLKNNLPEPGHGWANYPKGVIAELAQSGISLPGIDLVFAGDIPIGANLSSSAAIEAATLEAVIGLLEQPMTRWQKAFTCWRAENRFVGMPCGILDQFTIFNADKDCVMFLDCDRLASELIRFEFKGVKLLVINSGVGRELVRSEYTQRRKECDAAFSALRKAGFKISSLSSITPKQLPKAERALKPLLMKRVRHVVTENARVCEAKEAVRKQDFKRLGKLFDQGYKSSSNDYNNSTPELDLLHKLLSKRKEILGARIAGAGWGGCLVSLASDPDPAALESYLRESYRKITGREVKLFPVETGEAPGELK